MKMTNEEYGAYVKERSPRSPILKNCSFAFLIGGGICAFGQVLVNFYKSTGLELIDARAATSITLILIGGLLTGLGVYDDIGRVAGAGTLVPITGFANAIVSPAMEFKSEGYVLGVSAKMFVVAGPVLVFGTLSSFLYGVILLLIGRG